MYSPIVLFVYNRPWHTRKTVDALLRNSEASESDLYIYSDAAKSEVDVASVCEVREYINNIKGFRSIKVIERKYNYGLAKSIIDGVSSVINRYDCAIVLEDDLLVSSYFLEYMNSALKKYENELHVMQISGHMFPVSVVRSTDAVFLPMVTSWGWATWGRAWRLFDENAELYSSLVANMELRNRFNLNGGYDYFSMLESQRAGRVDSWAIRWYLTVFMRDGLTLFPAKSMVANAGFDGSGVHCGRLASSVLMPDPYFRVVKFPSIFLDQALQYEINAYLSKENNFYISMKNRLKEMFFKIVGI